MWRQGFRYNGIVFVITLSLKLPTTKMPSTDNAFLVKTIIFKIEGACGFHGKAEVVSHLLFALTTARLTCITEEI